MALSLTAVLLIVSPAVAADEDGPSRWEAAIAALEQQDRRSPPPKDAVLFVGSSSIRLWDLAKSFPEQAVINRGFGGSEVADAVHFADRIVLKHEPRTVVLYAGDNDLARGKTPQQVAADFATFVKTVRADVPQAKIVYIAIKPSVARWKLADTIRQTNALIRAICAEGERLVYLDVFTPMLDEDGRPRPDLLAKDGLHLNDAGYQLWTELLRPHIE